MADPAFDIGVLMGSQSPTVFDEYCSMHHGAKRFRKLWEQRCKCGQPDCFRHGLQELARIAENDQQLILAFLNCFDRAFEPLTFEEFEIALEQLYNDVEAKYGKFGVDKLAEFLTSR